MGISAASALATRSRSPTGWPRLAAPSTAEPFLPGGDLGRVGYIFAIPTFGPEQASCEVLTFRDGLLSPLAHDLVLRVTAFEISVDPATLTVTARFDARSLRVETALRSGRVLPNAISAGDRRSIEATIVRDVLSAERFPEIRFASTQVTARGDGFEVRGMLTLTGRTREVSAAVQRKAERLETEVVLRQPDFGIRPYSAMLGAIRVKPEVRVRVSVPAMQAHPARQHST